MKVDFLSLWGLNCNIVFNTYIIIYALILANAASIAFLDGE